MSQAQYALCEPEYGNPANDAAGLPIALSIYADRAHLRGTIRDDAQAAGFRIADCNEFGVLLEGDARPLGEVVVLDCPTIAAAELAALSRLDMRAAHCGAQLIVSTRLEALDDVFACLDQSGPQILIEPSRADRVIALGQVLGKLAGDGRVEIQEAGLAWDAATTTRAVQSPFDHAKQGRLVVVQTAADPKDVDGYTREMLGLLMDDLRDVRRGALVLFTSKAQMRQAQALLERGEHADLRERVLVQGEASRTVLLRRHTQRVGEGDASILFGLQSFGEGLDLPGELCEWVFITKLPFASPSDPVGQARADWLKSQGRDPFSELVVPATGARLLQWTGRALRTETDEAVVVCYDARLLRQSYGRRMLKGLPPYRLQRRVDGVLTDA